MIVSPIKFQSFKNVKSGSGARFGPWAKVCQLLVWSERETNEHKCASHNEGYKFYERGINKYPERVEVAIILKTMGSRGTSKKQSRSMSLHLGSIDFTTVLISQSKQ